MKRLIGVAMAKLQQQVLGTIHNLSDFKKVIVQNGSSFAVHDSWQDDFKDRFTKISPRSCHGI